MGLRSTSLCLLLAASALAAAEPFGRFGYTPAPVPGFVLSKEGFKTNFGRADLLRFAAPASVWKPVATSDMSQTVFLGETVGSPQKLKIDLLAPGFSIYSKGEIKFHIGSTSGPLLTWAEGSVEAGVPVPPTKWLLMSFRDAQPPILFSFLDGPVSAKLDGKVGDWTLTTAEPYKGWIRIVAPIGLEPFATNTAAELGALFKRVSPGLDVWTQQAPMLRSLTLKDEATAVVATWHFDRPGAVVPEPISLAAIGGYPIKVPKTRRLVENLENGVPLDVLVENEMTVRFPMRRIPTGRALQLGVPALEGPSAVVAHDIAGVTELALANLVSARGVAARSLALQTLSTYLTDAAYTEEPYTNQRLPFDGNGKGLDLAAAHALLMQATTSGERASSQPNSILTSLTWRRDWSTWRLWSSDSKVSRRAGALAALAGALCPEPERRLEAAMLEAGLAAERGLAILEARRQGGYPPPLLEVMDPLRRVLFTFGGKLPLHDAFTYSLLTDLRVFGPRQITAEGVAGGALLSCTVEQPGQFSFTLVSSHPIDVQAVENASQVQVAEAFGFYQVKATAGSAGVCRLKVVLPTYAPQLPSGAPVPKYAEIER